MLINGTLVKVDDALITAVANALRWKNGPLFDGRARQVRNSMTESNFGGEDYNGFFKVEFETSEDGEPSSTLKIFNGMSEAYTDAGYAYYNLVAVSCPTGSVSVSEGYLLLNIDGKKNVTYTIEQEIPDMPIERSGSGEGKASYPIAFITKSEEEDGGEVEPSWKIYQITRYVIPHLFCWGVCDEATGKG